MTFKKFKKCIPQYLNNSSSLSETEKLEFMEWLKVPENEEYFIECVEINYLMELNLKKFDKSSSENKLLDFISREEKQKKVARLRKVKVFFKYAAAVPLFIFFTLYFLNKKTVSTPDKIAVSPEKITLKMGDEKIEVIDEKTTLQIKDKKGNLIGTQKGDELIYNNKYAAETLSYNTLTVPYGKRFAVTLSDGTKVHLNAGTSFSYPVKFLENKSRRVFIDYGEAYFDVVNDPDHPFVVESDRVDVRVLGTLFNMRLYPEDSNVTTVLVEGAVDLCTPELEYTPQNARSLKPGDKADWNKHDQTVAIEKVDVNSHTAWTRGKTVAKNMKFNDFTKKLERRYNVKITNHDKALDEEYITATFDTETVEQVFVVINELHPIKYDIDKQKITIHQRP